MHESSQAEWKIYLFLIYADAWYSTHTRSAWRVSLICWLDQTYIDFYRRNLKTVLAAGDSGSKSGAASSVGGAGGGRRCRVTAGLQLHGQANPEPAGTERHTPGGSYGHESRNNYLLPGENLGENIQACISTNVQNYYYHYIIRF